MNTPAQSANAIETWDNRYTAEGYLFGKQPNAWLRDHASVWKPGGRVLCVADGEGRNSVWLATQGLEVDAFDVSTVAVEKARRLAAERGVAVRLSVADCDHYTWDEGAYDGVAAIFIQFADPDLRARIFARSIRSLKPGGALILQGYTPQQLVYRTGGPGILAHLYTAPMLREAFRDLDIVDLREYEAEIDEGTGHRGRSALVGLVGRRR